MEYEVRYYFPKEKLTNIIEKLKKFKELNMKSRCYEKTSQYDHPNDNMSFYSKEIDGRFRIRISKSKDFNNCKISWKRRIPDTKSSDVNKEEEIELTIKYEEYDNLMFLINNVLKMKNIESYERYRTVFANDDVEISVDEYPFGIALEIENKSSTKDPQEVVRYWTKKLGLDITKSYRLSLDDKYSELCKSQNIQQYNHVTFDKPMPKVIE